MHVPLGAIQAGRVDKAPAQVFSRVVFVTNGDRLLLLSFTQANLGTIGYRGTEPLYKADAES